jgi:2-keto-4-pentenoate hydratase
LPSKGRWRCGSDGGIAAAFPVIELHNFIFRGPRKTLVELVANNGLNAGIVLPAGEWLTSRAYLTADATLGVHINGRRLGSGSLWPLPGGPGASLEWLRSHLADHKLTLTSGQVVLAGTALELYPVSPGDHVAVSIGGVPTTECFIA